MKKLVFILLGILVGGVACFFAFEYWYASQYAMAAKPVIYLYPEETDEQCDAKPVVYLYPEGGTEVSVQLDYNGDLHYTYPTYENGGWDVIAYPDGTIYDKTGREYSYLFWDGFDHVEYDMSQGFVVAGCATERFLQEKLEYLGLTPKEYNEFIVYWLPQMISNPYNLITFQGGSYTDNAKLTITPEPDSIQRVFMAYTPLEEYMEVEEQVLEPFERHGFTVIEWGGAMVAT